MAPYFFIAFAFLAVSINVDAAESVPYSAVRASLNSWLAAYKLNPGAPIPNARDFVDVDFEVRARPSVTPTVPNPTPITRYATRPVALTASRASQMLGGALMRSTPAGIGISAALVALPYFFDDTTGNWTAEPITPDANPDSFTSTPTPLGSNACPLMSVGEYMFTQNSTWVYTYYKSLTINSEPSLSGMVAVAYCNSEPTTGGLARTIWRSQTRRADWPISIPGGQASDVDVVSGLPDFVPQVVDEVISSPDYRDQWPELGDVADALKRWAENEFEGGSNPVETVNNASQDATENPRPINVGSPTAAEWPGFCSWATPVCTFIDWFTDIGDLPENPDIPEVEIEIDDFNSGIGEGACPADISVSTQFGTFPISWEYPCELATTFKPIVLFFSWITALYIIVRVK